MILVPSLYHVNTGAGSPKTSQSNVPFPWMSISCFSGGGFESFHFGATMEANVPIHDCLAKWEQVPQHNYFISYKHTQSCVHVCLVTWESFVFVLQKFVSLHLWCFKFLWTLTTALTKMEVGCLRPPGASTIGNSQLLDEDCSYGWQILATQPWARMQ